MSESPKQKRYWRANIRLVLALLAVWFVVSFGCGILFVDPLNKIKLGGFPLGFWFAQQGAIYVFVVLVWLYARRMDKMDAVYNAEIAQHEEGQEL